MGVELTDGLGIRCTAAVPKTGEKEVLSVERFSRQFIFQYLYLIRSGQINTVMRFTGTLGELPGTFNLSNRHKILSFDYEAGGPSG